MNKKFLKNFLIICIFLIAVFFIIIYTVQNPIPEKIKYVNIAKQNIKVELAITKEEQELGLGERDDMGRDSGMLFVFKESGKYYFWMKDMNFPIDIIWIDENMKVAYIKKDAVPESYPESYGPNTNTKYVLEVYSGFSDKNNLKLGDMVNFTY